MAAHGSVGRVVTAGAMGLRAALHRTRTGVLLHSGYTLASPVRAGELGTLGGSNLVQMLTLRYPGPEDAPAVSAAVQESIEALHAWMAWCRREFSLADASNWISQQPEARKTGTAFEFLVCDTSGELVGVCGVNQINQDYRYGNLGYWVRSSRAGQGMATLAARQVADWAFNNTELERLEIVVATGNTASQRVAEKLGSVREGVLRSRLLIHGVFHDAVMNSLIRPPRGTA